MAQRLYKIFISASNDVTENPLPQMKEWERETIEFFKNAAGIGYMKKGLLD